VTSTVSPEQLPDPYEPKPMVARYLVPLLAGLFVVALAACGGGGSTHEIGEQVSVTRTQESGGPNAPTTTLGISVLRVRKGAQADLDLAGLEVEPDDTSKTPYYVNVQFENQGTESTERLLYVSLEDQDGELISPINIFDLGLRFAKCPGTTFGELAPGESIEICSTFFVPEGREPVRVAFLPYDPAAETGYVYWKVA
jgi:hypothetical protein